MGLKSLIIKALMKQRQNAYISNLENIKKCINSSAQTNPFFCDLGCDDGVWSLQLAKQLRTKNVYGLEIVESQRKLAISNGVIALNVVLNCKFPYNDNFFDVIHANQVIEHLTDTDQFVEEIHRVLKPGGYAVISTENLASWHNIFALLLGFMPFSLVNVSMKTAALGNKLAPHNDEQFWSNSSWQHLRVFTVKGLIHLFELFGFEVKSVYGAGYYPLGNWAAKLDPIHSAFITLCVYKPI